LKLAYDLRYATDHFPGIGTHAAGLAAALLERERIERITFLWNPRARNTRFELGPLRAHPRAAWYEVSEPAMGLGTARATGRLLETLQPDAFLSPFWLKPEGTRVPCVLTLHDVLPLALPAVMDAPRRWAYGYALARAADAAAVLTSSRFSRDEILRLTRIPAKRLNVVPLGIAEPSPIARRPAGVPEGPFALCVGSDRAHKGLETLAEVWRGFGAEPPLHWVWAGPGAVRGRLPFAARREFTGAHALGTVSTIELEWLYRNATLVLVPSRYEGFGLPLLEACARGVPVVASDIPALRETGVDVTCFVPPGDAPAWAAAIRSLVADATERARMRAAGLARAAEYGYERCATRIESILFQVAATPARAPA
jgi:alpha-1,3-rhamnosyl/mannosyltransferase